MSKEILFKITESLRHVVFITYNNMQPEKKIKSPLREGISYLFQRLRSKSTGKTVQKGRVKSCQVPYPCNRLKMRSMNRVIIARSLTFV
jgi:hypothetical protein